MRKSEEARNKNAIGPQEHTTRSVARQHADDGMREPQKDCVDNFPGCLLVKPVTHACQAFWQDEQGGRRRAMSARGKLLECYLEDVEIRDGTILVSLSLPAPIEAMRCLSNFLSPGHFNHSRTLRCLSQQHVRGSVLANPLLRAQPRRSCRTAGLQQH